MSARPRFFDGWESTFGHPSIRAEIRGNLITLRTPPRPGSDVLIIRPSHIGQQTRDAQRNAIPWHTKGGVPLMEGQWPLITRHELNRVRMSMLEAYNRQIQREYWHRFTIKTKALLLLGSAARWILKRAIKVLR